MADYHAMQARMTSCASLLAADVSTKQDPVGTSSSGFVSDSVDHIVVSFAYDRRVTLNLDHGMQRSDFKKHDFTTRHRQSYKMTPSSLVTRRHLRPLHAAVLVTAGPLDASSSEDTKYVPRSLRESKHLRPTYEKRDAPQFVQGQPINGKGKDAPIAGGTNEAIDLQNPDDLGAQSTDNDVVPNLKWSFSDSKTWLTNGGRVREQVVTDLPSSHDIAGVQQYLTEGSYRELHWHKVAEWGYVYEGAVSVSAVDEHRRNSGHRLDIGGIWYFPKGAAHTIQGLEDQNEDLLCFDDGNFDATGTTIMVDDWIAHTSKDVLAKNFGVDANVFNNTPTTDPYILKGTVEEEPTPVSPNGKLGGASSYVCKGSSQKAREVAGCGGTISIGDSTNFPISKTTAAPIVTLKRGALHELHWHPNAEERLYFHRGTAHATVFLGGVLARTFDFRSGDIAVFPDDYGHYVENTSKNETLVWIEIYKSDRVADIVLAQWLALTPSHIVAQKGIKKEKQLLVA